MTVYFITRHPGAVAWARNEGIEAGEVVEHLDVANIQAGDTVVGTLPVNLAAQVCARGARYLHLSLELPPDMRGKELTAEDMQRLGARLEAFHVQRTTH
jgi:CRISPR-associated protein Csx16